MGDEISTKGYAEDLNLVRANKMDVVWNSKILYEEEKKVLLTVKAKKGNT